MIMFKMGHKLEKNCNFFYGARTDIFIKNVNYTIEILVESESFMHEQHES